MGKNIDKLTENYRIQKSSTVIISFIGIAFIFIAGINYSIGIPTEHIIGVSFAAFFFVLADFSLMSKKNEKFQNEKLYFLFLLFAVMSFILLPIIIPLLTINNRWLASASESLSIASLGLVLVMMNLKLWKAEEEYFDEFKILNDKTLKILMEYQNKFQSSTIKNNEAVEMMERVANVAESSNIVAERTLDVHGKLIKIIEEAETLEEIKEKAKLL